MTTTAVKKFLAQLVVSMLAWGAPALAESKQPTPVETASECFPSCRSGYVCHAGACVSQCNPACDAGERCLPNGECVAQGGSSENVSTVAPAMPAATPTPTAGKAPAAPETDELRAQGKGAAGSPGSLVFGLRLGASLFSGGEHEVGCSSSVTDFCAGVASTVNASDRSPLVIGIDGLAHASAGLRLGLSYWFIPYSGVRFDDGSDDTFHLGNAHRLLAVVEGLVALGGNSKLALRAQAGLAMLLVGGELEESNKNFLDSCTSSSLDHCNAERSPFLGGSYGVQIGFIASTQLRWRTDLALERFTQQTSVRRIRDVGETIRVDETSSGTRLVAWVGLEL